MSSSRLGVHGLVKRWLAYAAVLAGGGGYVHLAAAQPVNDDRAQATVIPPSGGTQQGTCADATNDGYPIFNCDGGAGVDVWYSFTPTSSGPWRFSLCATLSPWDTTLTVVNPDIGGPEGVELACDDEGCGPPGMFGVLSIINSLTLTPGQRVLIRVAGYDEFVPGQAFTLTVTSLAPVTGTCCTGNSCSIRLQSACVSPATWTAGGACSPNPCLPPTGACCDGFLNCSTTTLAGCVNASNWQLGVACGPGVCTYGGCCNPSEATCTIGLRSQCAGGPTQWSSTNLCSPRPECPNGACCDLTTGSCSILTGSACLALAQHQFTLGGCTPSPCAVVTGSCCSASGSCTVSTLTNCTSPAVWTSRANCSPNLCAQPTGACCFNNGSSTFCSVVAQADCANSFAVAFLGVGSTCSSDPCMGGFGACCNLNGTCVFTVSPLCTGGSVFLSGNSCQPANCPAPGACCNLTSGACSTTFPDLCDAQSRFLGAATTCSANPCGPVGRCCLASGACVPSILIGCVQSSLWLSGGSCSPDTCPGSPPNDLCQNATALPMSTVLDFQTTFRSTGSDITACSSTDQDVWYVFQPPAPGRYRVLTRCSRGLVSLAAFAANVCPPAVDSELACAQQQLEGPNNLRSLFVDAPSSAPLFVRVGDRLFSALAPNAEFSIRVDPYTEGTPPANDLCSSSDPFVRAGEVASGNSQHARTDMSLPICLQGNNGARPGRDVFFRFVPTCTGYYSISSCGSNFSTQLDVLTDCSGTPQSRLFCDFPTFNACGVSLPANVVNAFLGNSGSGNYGLYNAGQLYYIRLSGAGNLDNSEMGSYEVRVLPNQPCPVGACCSGAICVLTTLDNCTGPSQRFAGANVACNLSGNITTPCRTSDFDQSGTSEIADIFTYLSAWFSQSLAADVDGSGEVNLADLFAFLSAWFTP